GLQGPGNQPEAPGIATVQAAVRTAPTGKNSCRAPAGIVVAEHKQLGRIVNNESREIIRMMSRALAPLGDRGADLCPPELEAAIDREIDRMYAPVNNGVYRAGFATTQRAYDEAVGEVFAALDDYERALSRRRWLVGHQPTEADVCLFTTLVRFDAVYHYHFKCNLRRLRDYPSLWGFVRDVYQLPGVRETVDLRHIKEHYFRSHERVNPTRIVPVGPELDFEAPPGRGRLESATGPAPRGRDASRPAARADLPAPTQVRERREGLAGADRRRAPLDERVAVPPQPAQPRGLQLDLERGADTQRHAAGSRRQDVERHAVELEPRPDRQRAREAPHQQIGAVLVEATGDLELERARVDAHGVGFVRPDREHPEPRGDPPPLEGPLDDDVPWEEGVGRVDQEDVLRRDLRGVADRRRPAIDAPLDGLHLAEDDDHERDRDHRPPDGVPPRERERELPREAPRRGVGPAGERRDELDQEPELTEAGHHQHAGGGEHRAPGEDGERGAERVEPRDPARAEPRDEHVRGDAQHQRGVREPDRAELGQRHEEIGERRPEPGRR
ncbi:MAG: glutathione S-transferase C-terminal domain-containing protein, partial [Polyangiaceae bacterium]|nr:glutathione S-transferase C-terminal domain-containing protein [Polyangiaceae bacterium]